MGKQGYKKFMKQERARVKIRGRTVDMKSKKGKKDKFLPKGQNVTDTNFKVKKIIIKDQLKEKNAGVMLSKRKLTLQEVLSRLNHHNHHVVSGALSDLEELLGRLGDAIGAAEIASVASGLMSVIVSSHVTQRSSANKLLILLLNQVSGGVSVGMVWDEVMWRLRCGLTSLDSGVQWASLQALSAVVRADPPGFHSAPTLLPSLLDLVSRSTHSGRALDPMLTSHHRQSPASWRTTVFSTIHLLLSSHSSTLMDSSEVQENVKPIRIEPGHFVKLEASFTLPGKVEGLSFNLHQSKIDSLNELDFKEFSRGIVPIALESFMELVLSDDDDESVGVVNDVGRSLLGSVTNLLLSLREVLVKLDRNNDRWFKKEFAARIYNHLFSSKFPYRARKGGCRLENLRLALLVTLTSPPSKWSQISSFLTGEMKRWSSLAENERHLLSCVVHEVAASSVEAMSDLGPSLAALAAQPDSPSWTFAHQILSRIALDITGTYTHIFKEEWMCSWLAGLLGGVISCPAESDGFISTVAALASHSFPSFIDSLNGAIEEILERLPGLTFGEELKLSVAGLIYWVTEWDAELVNNLARGIRNNFWGPTISNHIFLLVISKSCCSSELLELLKADNWWREKL